MATIVWDAVGERLYEVGVSKGVFYDSDGYGVAWNGLTSVEESTANKVQPIYYDGFKINDIVSIGDFSATIKAFTYPDELLPYEGVLEDVPGFLITGQQPNRFGLSYQTKIGNDVNNLSFGYKIHLLYNLTAVPTQKNYSTLTLDVEPTEFEWNITAIPELIENYRPTAHVIFDSTKMSAYLLKSIEDTLYGSASIDPQLPSLKSLTNAILG